ncbi:MAG: amidohydrolase [Eubacteriaceae bacterium]|nr:amidohydrolase [Eubacteriaceae bacterium]
MATDYQSLAKEIREELHKIPEPGYGEFKTQAFVMGFLKKIGLDPVPAAKTGVACFVNFGKDETIAFRADMDGLPITEETCLSFKSESDGFMHACGHDGHMAMLLSFAQMLANRQVAAKANALLIFQPAEEGPGGAEAILREGYFAAHNVTKAYGIHVHPGYPFGEVHSKPGDFFAECVELYFTLKGKSAHGAQPQDGQDALLAACHLAVQLSSLVGKTVSPLEGAVLMLGKIEAGDRLNVIAEHARLEGSLRAYSHENVENLVKRIGEISQGISASFGVLCDFRPVYFYPALKNDSSLFLEAKALAPYILEAGKLMLSEDFAYYARAVPSVFFLLGVDDGKEEHKNALHSSRFSFDSRVLIKGVSLYKDLIS